LPEPTAPPSSATDEKQINDQISPPTQSTRRKKKNEEKNPPVNAKQEKKKPMKKNVKTVKGNATTASQLVEERRCIVRIL
jgi:hypothetical protein